MKFSTTLLAAVATLALSGAANAALITAGSQLNLNGFDRAQPDDGMTTLDNATGLDFTAGTGATPGVDGVLTGANGSGDFAALGTCNTGCGSIVDMLSFSGFTGQTAEYTAILPGGTVTFDLDAPLSINRYAATAQSLAVLSVSGSGTFHLDGYDATPGTFTLTSQGNAITTFSASTVTQSAAIVITNQVPEPMSLALLGTGLAGLGLIRRRKS